MRYSISLEACQEKLIHSCSWSELLPYSLLSVDKESYIVGATIENSDEGWLSTGRLVHNLQIGRYCSLADEIFFLIGRGKDYLRVSTSSAKVFLLDGIGEYKHHEKGSLIIENDVWVGYGASFMSGVTVHNGAIVGAKAHVVKDVPPYAIVGGNPARIVGYRFDEETIRKLLVIQWWYWPEEKIERNARCFYDTEMFCKQFYDEAKYEIDNVIGEVPVSEKDRYLLLVDNEDNYSVTPDVIDEFMKKYSGDKEKELILYWIKSDEEINVKYLQSLKVISEKVHNSLKIQCEVSLIEGEIDELKKIMPSIKHLIINRKSETVRVMCYAEVYGKKVEIISGVDMPILL